MRDDQLYQRLQGAGERCSKARPGSLAERNRLIDRTAAAVVRGQWAIQLPAFDSATIDVDGVRGKRRRLTSSGAAKAAPALWAGNVPAFSKFPNCRGTKWEIVQTSSS